MQNIRLFFLTEIDLKILLKYCDKLRQSNKQTVVEHYFSVLRNNHESMYVIPSKDLNDSKVLIVELLRSCSKQIINIFQLSQLMAMLWMESY